MPKIEQSDLKALFGDYGSALIIGIQPDGKVATCDIAHEALKQKPISSPSSVKMSDFKNEGGQISGKLADSWKTRSVRPKLGSESHFPDKGAVAYWSQDGSRGRFIFQVDRRAERLLQE